MLEKHGEILVHFLEGLKQPLPTFLVQALNPVAQCPDRVFEIGLFADQQGVLGLDLARIFLGAQVHSAERIA